MDFKKGWEQVKSALGYGEGADIIPSEYRGSGGMFYFNEGVSPDKRLFNFTDNYKSPIAAYLKCPPVAAIINRKSQAFSNGKTWILNRSGKARDKESTSEPANKLRRLLTKPNPIQTGTQFESQVYGMVQLYGYAVVLLIKPVGFPNIDADRMYVLPNWCLTIYESLGNYTSDKNGKVISKITWTYGGGQIDLPLDAIAIIKDLTPALCTVVLPESRIKPLELPINNVIGSYESRNVLINRRGPQGILTEDVNPIGNIPMTETDKADLQRDFSRYGLKEKQWRVIFGKNPMKYVNMGYNVAELQLHEEARESGIAICNGLSYPPFLLGLSDSTYNNQAEASRGLYMETTIPEAANIYEQYDIIFDTPTYNIYLNKDYSHVSALQEDQAKAATARKTRDEALEKEFKNNVITLNRWRVLQDEDPTEDEFGSMYYWQLLAAGWTFGTTQQQSSTQTQNN